jgi:hypothetical protein
VNQRFRPTMHGGWAVDSRSTMKSQRAATQGKFHERSCFFQRMLGAVPAATGFYRIALAARSVCDFLPNSPFVTDSLCTRFSLPMALSLGALRAYPLRG